MAGFIRRGPEESAVLIRPKIVIARRQQLPAPLEIRERKSRVEGHVELVGPYRGLAVDILCQKSPMIRGFRGAQLANAAEVLTADFGFKEAVASADSPTLLSDKTAQDLRKLVLDDPDWETLRLYRLVDGRPYQLVLAPLLAPDLIGWAAIGFALDERVVLEMSRLTGVEVSIVEALTKAAQSLEAGDYSVIVPTNAIA
jgi:hypothetical protein